MARLRMRILMALVTALAGVGVGLGTAQPASAASCYGASCNALSPTSTGCDASAYTAPVGDPDAIVRVDLRRSVDCQATWARYVNTRGCGLAAAVQIQTGVRNADGTFKVVNSQTAYGCAKFWTKMLNGVGRYARVRMGADAGDHYSWDSWSRWWAPEQ